MKKKGFTLVELLVVVSVIGVLTTVVLSSLNDARDKAKEKAILAEVRSVYQEGEIYYSGSFEYAPGIKSISNCPTSEDVSWGFLGTEKGLALINSIKEKAGATNPYDATCAISPESWVVSVNVYDAGVLASSTLVNAAYAQSIEGYICFDNGRRVQTSNNTIQLDSNGDARQDPVGPGIEVVSANVFACQQ